MRVKRTFVFYVFLLSLSKRCSKQLAQQLRDSRKLLLKQSGKREETELHTLLGDQLQRLYTCGFGGLHLNILRVFPIYLAKRTAHLTFCTRMESAPTHVHACVHEGNCWNQC